MMKRRAQVSGKRLEIDCVLEELDTDHLPEIRKVFEETNSEYSKFYAVRRATHAAEQAKRDAETARLRDCETAKLAELKKNIKFD